MELGELGGWLMVGSEPPVARSSRIHMSCGRVPASMHTLRVRPLREARWFAAARGDGPVGPAFLFQGYLDRDIGPR